MISIIDYKAGNLTSVKRALDFLGWKSVITGEYKTIIDSERVIFPGVGAAGSAMADLKRKGLDHAITEFFKSGRPILGICLGTQIIMEKSPENDTQCLGLIEGQVSGFPGDLRDDEKRLKVPHMGWNKVHFRSGQDLFEGVDPDSEFYFVHSYFPVPHNEETILGKTFYGIWFASVVMAENLVATQFHPEKSGRPGLRVLDNFCKWSGKPGC